MTASAEAEAENAELLHWKVTMVRLASAQQQCEEPLFAELLSIVKNRQTVEEWHTRTGQLRHRLAEVGLMAFASRVCSHITLPSPSLTHTHNNTRTNSRAHKLAHAHSHMRTHTIISQAKDNVKYLYAIAEVTRPLRREAPKRLAEAMPRIVHSVAWMACISRFFNTPDRLAALFHRLSVRVVRACRRAVYGAWSDPLVAVSATDEDTGGSDRRRQSASSLLSGSRDGGGGAGRGAVASHWDRRARAALIVSVGHALALCESFAAAYEETRKGLKKFPSAPQFGKSTLVLSLDFSPGYLFMFLLTWYC